MNQVPLLVTGGPARPPPSYGRHWYGCLRGHHAQRIHATFLTGESGDRNEEIAGRPCFFGGKRNMKYPIGLKLIARLYYKLLSMVSNIEIDVLRPDVQLLEDIEG
jgi:hypothetical protein